MQLSQKPKTFSQFFSFFFLRFLNLDSILNVFRKRKAFKTDTFLNLQPPKNVVR